MKSEHRHELKTNELADWIANLPEWADENRNMIITVAVVIVVALVVYFWSYYRRAVVSVGQQTRLTNLVTQVQQKTNDVARAAMQNNDLSYDLLPLADDLQTFAQNTSDKNVAALALIQRGETLRAELHYRLAEISPEDQEKQIAKARESYQLALEQAKSNSTLAASARLGLGLCEEELGRFDQAAEIYRAIVQQPEYAGTVGQATAAYRLQVMDDFKTPVVFKPAPPRPQPPAAQAPTIQLRPGDANAPVIRAPQNAPAVPFGPAPEPTPAPAPAQPQAAPTPATPAPVQPQAVPAPTPAAPVPTPPAETNKPAGG
jgi:tetratricopeptide (TPR) repeat protein